MASSSTPEMVIAASGLAYPHSLIFPSTNPHPGLRAIVDHFAGLTPLPDNAWRPTWATGASDRPAPGRASPKDVGARRQD